MFLLFLTTQNSYAGAFGLTTHGGLYQGKAYYYRSDDEQGFDSQYRPNAGGGIEFMLGNRKDRLQGILRLQYSRDWPLEDPAYVEEDGYTYSYPPVSELPPTDVGKTSIGLQWGILGEPTGAQLIATTSLVSAFWTTNALEYFQVDVGIGGTYTINDQIQFHTTLNAAPRYRKALTFGYDLNAGVRYLFD